MDGIDGWGEIRKLESTSTAETSPGALGDFERTLVEWVPPNIIADCFPVGCSIRLNCRYTDNGFRTFSPEHDDLSWLEALSHSVGTRLRMISGKMPSEWAESADAQRFCSQWMKARHDFAKRKFSFSRDVHVVKSSRAEGGEHSCTEAFAYLDPRLKGIGLIREAAKTDNSRKKFHDGLYEISKCLKLTDITNKTPSEIIRDAFLLHKKELTSVTTEQLEEVQDRVCRKIAKRNALDSDDDTGNKSLSEWLASSKTNLPTVISRMPGRLKLSRDEVNACLFELGWFGLKQSAINLHTTMFCIANAIGDLCDDERQAFDNLYQLLPELGDFPLAMLLDRHEFIEPARLEILRNGTTVSKVVPQVLIMLHFYGMMLGHRRKADRIGKSKKNAAGETSQTVQLAGEVESIEDSSYDLCDYIIGKLGLKCASCGSSDLELEIVKQPKVDSFKFPGRCNECKQVLPDQVFTISMLNQRFDKKDFVRST